MVGPEVFDSQRAGGYSPLDFPPSAGLCWASWRRRQTGEEPVCGASFELGARNLATDQDAQSEVPGNAWTCNQSWADIDRKVRTER